MLFNIMQRAAPRRNSVYLTLQYNCNKYTIANFCWKNFLSLSAVVIIISGEVPQLEAAAKLKISSLNLMGEMLDLQ